MESVFTPDIQAVGAQFGEYQLKPLSALIHILHERFVHLGQEDILELCQQRRNFAKRSDKTFEMMVVRFDDIHQKYLGATGEQMNHTVEASDLLEAMKLGSLMGSCQR